MHKTLFAAAAMNLALSSSVWADTIYRAVAGNPKSESVVVTDVLVDAVLNTKGEISEDVLRASGEILIVYYHFWNPATQMLESKLRTRESGERLRVAKSNPQARQKLITAMQERGARARVTRTEGGSVVLYCVKASYRIPIGKLFIDGEEQGLPDETSISFRSEADPSVNEFIPFSHVTLIAFDQGIVSLHTRDGRALRGRWSKGTARYGGQERRDISIILVGIIADGTIARVPLDEVLKIEFK